MKKILSLLLTVLFASSVMAADPIEIASGTFDGKNEKYTDGWTTTATGKQRNDCVVVGKDEYIGSPTVDLSEFESITISIKARRYGKFSGSKATIAVTFGTTSIGSTEASTTTATDPLADITYTNTGLSTGFFVFTCTNASDVGSAGVGAGINSITITGIKKSTSGVSNPTISPSDVSEFDGSLTISLACTTSGASIYYTLDGTDPTNASTLYKSSFTINQTTTVQAIAYKNGAYSNAVSKTFTKIEKLTCAEYAALATGTIAYLNDVVVTATDNARNTWVRDASGSLLIYCPSGSIDNDTYNYSEGEVISGLKGDKYIYNTVVPELRTSQKRSEVQVTTGSVPEPEEFTTLPTTKDLNKYIEIKDAEVVGSFVAGTLSNLDVTLGTATVTMRNAFGNGYTFESGKKYNVKAIVSYYSDALQLYFVSAEEVIQEVTTTVYFVNTLKWPEVYAYVWDNNLYPVEFAGWPGEAMTKTTEQVNGYDVYSYTFPAKYSNIIFNNVTVQTNELTWSATEPYYYMRNDTWYTSLNDIPADTPTPDDLKAAGYDLNKNVVLVTKFTGDAANVSCDGVYFVGTYNDWDLNNAAKMEALSGFDGWYVVSTAYTQGCEGKPIHVDYDGNLDWFFQPAAKSWTWVAGNGATISDNTSNNETSVTYPSAGAYIYEISAWKGGDPCKKEQHSYTIGIYPPVCSTADYKPAVVLHSEGYTILHGMEKTEYNGKDYYYATVTTYPGDAFSYREASDIDNEILWNKNDTWVSDGNYSLGHDYTYDRSNNLSDPDFYKWSKCVETPAIPTHEYTVKFYAPNVCDEVPAIIGHFSESNWTKAIEMTPAVDIENKKVYYTYTFTDEEGDASTDHGFKILGAATDDANQTNSWNNQLLKFDGNNWITMENFALGTETTITLDCSDWKTYRFGECTYTLPSKKVVIGVFLPDGVPAVGAEVLGSFNDWRNYSYDQIYPLEEVSQVPGLYYIVIDGVTADDAFKIRQMDTWYNEIMVYDESYTDPNTGEHWRTGHDIYFGQAWFDASVAAKLYPALSAFSGMVDKAILLTLNAANKYKWKAQATCFYELLLTDRPNDGWDDNGRLQIKDGDFEAIYRCEYGESPTRIKVPYYGNDNVEFTWVGGDYTNENTITILAANGMGIFYHPEDQEMTAGELLFTMKTSPCTTAPNPYLAQNIKAELTKDYKMRVTWDAVEGASSYGIAIYTPQGVEIAKNARVDGTSYTSIVLTSNGKYTVTVTSYDAKGLLLGMNSITPDITVPSITTPVTINTFAPSDCNMDVSNGLWLVWRPYGSDNWNTPIKMSSDDQHLFVASFTPNAPSYEYYLMNTAEEGNTTLRTYSMENITAQKHCCEIQYRYDYDWAELQPNSACEFADHNYLISNPTATVAPGRVDFSWTAQKDIADKYTIYVYDINWNDITTLTVNNATSYSWGVEDQYDDVEIMWYVRPYSPYTIGSSKGNNVTLKKSDVTLTLESNSVTTSDYKSLDMVWAFNETNLHYLVEITDYDNNIVRREIVDKPSYHYEAPFNSTFNTYVTPLNTSDEVIGLQVSIGNIYLWKIPNIFPNLQGTANKRHLTFTWGGSVPKVKAELGMELSNGTWKSIATIQETTAQTLEFDVEEDGIYYLNLYPYIEVEPGKWIPYQYSRSCSVNVFTTSTYTVQISATTGGDVYPTELTSPTQYSEGFSLYISAYAETGYYFEKWSDGNTNYERTIYVDGDIDLQAIFKPAVLLSINITNSSYGNIYFEENFYSVYGWDGSGNYVIAYVPGTDAILTAVEKDGGEFVKWSDGVTTLTRTIPMTKDTLVVAEFKAADPNKQKYEVTITSEDTKKGTVPDINGKYTEGSVLEVTAFPNDGYLFTEWSDGKKENPRTFTVDGDITFYAKFEAKQYTLKLIAGAGGKVEPEGEKKYDYGTDVIIKAIPNTGYEFTKWSDGNPLAERVIQLVQDCTLTASFTEVIAPTKYSFSFDKEGEGVVESSVPAGSYEEGKQIVLTAKAAIGWHFERWSNGSTTNPLSITLTSNLIIKAIFVKDGETPKKYKVSITAGTGGTVKVDPQLTESEYTAGTQFTIEAIPNSGYKFVKWSDGDTNAKRTITITADTDLKASFESTGGGGGGEGGGGTTENVTLRVEIMPDGNAGSVLFDGEKISSMRKEVSKGSSIILTAKAAAGYVFVRFEDGSTNITKKEYEVTVNSSKTVYAVFKKEEEGIDSQKSQVESRKILINGEIYILRGGKMYTVQGQTVK